MSAQYASLITYMYYQGRELQTEVARSGFHDWVGSSGEGRQGALSHETPADNPVAMSHNVILPSCDTRS